MSVSFGDKYPPLGYEATGRPQESRNRCTKESMLSIVGFFFRLYSNHYLSFGGSKANISNTSLCLFCSARNQSCCSTKSAPPTTCSSVRASTADGFDGLQVMEMCS